MRFLFLFPFSRTRRVRTIKIKRVHPGQSTVAIMFHSVTTLTVLGLLTAILVLLAMAGGASVLGLADPALLSVLLSAHACTALFALNRSAH